MNIQAPLIIGFDAVDLDDRLQQHLLKINPVGIVLFRRNITSLEQCRDLIGRIKRLLGDILVAVDHEGGLVSRFPPDFPVPPAPAALHWTGSLRRVREACRMQAGLLREIGINLNFAPVLDLALNRNNEVIGTRAYSKDPREVGAYATVCVEEHNRQGIGSTAKHFPGYGRTVADTHIETGTVHIEADTLFETDLYPFRQAIEAGVPAVMTAHLTFTGIDPEAPVTFSKKMIGGVLRSRMGFNGLVISDCVEMAALGQHFTPAQIVSRSLFAGVDLILSSFSLIKDLNYQIALRDAWLKYLRESEGAEMHSRSLQRRRWFLSAYSKKLPVGASAVEMAPMLALHRQTLQKVRDTDLPLPFYGFFLIELSNAKRMGINPGETGNPVYQVLSTQYRRVRSHRILHCHDLSEFTACIQTANAMKLTVLLLTANGFRQGGFGAFIACLREASSAVHIALLESRDLQGIADLEWVTRGFNGVTANALILELDRRIRERAGD